MIVFIPTAGNKNHTVANSFGKLVLRPFFLKLWKILWIEESLDIYSFHPNMYAYRLGQSSLSAQVLQFIAFSAS